MINILDCKNLNYLDKLKAILNKRRFEKKINTNIASQIVNEIKKNKQKALLKYEKKLSKNDKIKPTAKEIKKSIKTLDPKIKKAIDFGGSSIRDFKGITGKSGNFQSEFKVYDRTKMRCSRNNCSGQISRKIISNRSTFICSVCQK